ncbi:MAG: hypothetical protein Q4D13_01260 [Erysipelotrichaceae bacterium]|nr:hypothetical protein [Erysipelotrichaceae bacterium]
MFKPQMKFQKILFLLALIFSAVMFVYGLGLMTGVYGLYQTQALGGVPGSKIFTDMQGYNNILVYGSIGLILISTLPFIFASNTRRKYYIGNTIATYVQAGAFVVMAVYVVMNTIKYRTQFLTTVDFTLYKEMSDMMNFNYSESTFWFDIGFVLAVILVVFAGAIVYNLIWKTKLVKQEDEILSGGVVTNE